MLNQEEEVLVILLVLRITRVTVPHAPARCLVAGGQVGSLSAVGFLASFGTTTAFFLQVSLQLSHF